MRPAVDGGNEMLQLQAESELGGNTEEVGITDFYTKRQIYKCVLKHENNALAQKFLVIMLGHNTLTYLQDYIFFIIQTAI